LAGTIELFSATPSDLSGVYAGLSYGSRESVDAHAGLGTRLGAGFVSVSGGYGRGDGFVPVVAARRGPVDRPSPYEQASVSLRAVAALTSTVELQANGLWFSDERERGTDFSAISTTGTDGSLRLVGARWSALAYVQTRDFANSFASVNAARASVMRVSEQYHVPSIGLGARFEVRPRVGDHVELRLGGDWRETVGETRERFAFQNGVGTRGRVAGGETRTLGGFAEGSFELASLTLTGGTRIDRWAISDGFLDERVLASQAVLNDVAFPGRSGWEPTARAGIAWRPAGAVTLRGATYLGWRLPTLNELYRPFRVGADTTAANPALAPERLKGIEAGIDYRPLSTARVGVTVFANRLDNAIANVTIGQSGGGQLRQRQNLGAIAVRGVEIDASLQLGAWSLAGGYSFADAAVRANTAAAPLDGLRPAQTPRHSFAATLGWNSRGGARASASARYVGGQYEDDLNAQILPGALTFDAAGSVPLGARLTLEARAENITDKRVVAGISGDGLVERATPRTLWIGVRWRG